MLTYDGTSWRTNDYNSNTTYSAMSVAEARAGTATTGRSIRADYLKTFLSTLGGSGLTLTHDATKGLVLDHTNNITAGTVNGNSGNVDFGGTITIPSITYDSEGHITETTTTSINLPVNPNTDTKVTQNSDTVSNTAYPIILAYGTSSGEVTNTVNKSNNLTYNPSTKILTVNNGGISASTITATNVVASTFTGALSGTAANALTADYALSAGGVDWGNVSNKPAAYTPTAHTHGNLSATGTLSTTATIGENDRLVIVDNGDSKKITSGIAFGTSANYVLSNAGTWVEANNYSLPIASDDSLGGIKVGSTLDISTTGVLNQAIVEVVTATSTATPAHSGTFTAIDSVSVDTYGRVTGYNTKTIKLPSDNNTDTKVTQSVTTTDSWRKVLLTGNTYANWNTAATTTTSQAYEAKDISVQPSTGSLNAANLSASDNISGKTATIANNITITTAGYGLYLTDLANTYAGIYETGAELWVGAAASNGNHHQSTLMLSTGHNGSQGNQSAYLSIPTLSGGSITGQTPKKIVYLNQNVTNGQVIVADGTAGGVKTTGYTIGTSVPANAVFTDTTYSAGIGIDVTNNVITNTGVRNIAPGTTEGTISVNINGTTSDVAVNGLGSAAYTDSANYVKKSGDTMTGVLTLADGINSDTYNGALNMNDSDIYNLNSIYTNNASDGAAEGIHFYRDSTHVDTLWVNGGDLLFVPNRALGTNTTKTNSQKVSRFTANPTSGQVVISDGTTGGVKTSGYTIATSVPSNAKFTDTTYTAGSGLNLSASNVFSITANGVTNAMLAGSIENSKLVNSNITIAGTTVALGSSIDANTLKTNLGLSNAMHFIGIATNAITDGSTTDPGITGYSTKTAGDVVIDKDTAYEYVWSGTKWERLGPDGSYIVSGATITYQPAGTINNHSYQPGGTVSQPTFTGTTATISMSGNVSGASVTAHSYTPQGSITVATTSTNKNYTPAGTVSQPTFSGTSATVYVNGEPKGSVGITVASNANGNYQPAGTIGSSFTGTTSIISVSGTPSGSIAVTAATTTTDANYTPEGTNAASAVTITPSTTTIYSMNSAGSVTAGVAASFTQGTDSFTGNKPTVIDTSKFNGGSYSHSGFSGGSSASLSMSVTDEVLSFNFTPNALASYGTDSFTSASFATGFYTAGTTATFTQGTDSFTANTPTAVTLPTRKSVTVWSGYTAATAAAQVFTGKEAKISAEFTGSSLTSTGSYCPAGSVSSSFSGTKVNIAGTFTGSATTFSGSYTPAGTVSQPTFTGTDARFTFSGTSATLSHSVTQGSVSLSASYQPAGTVSKPTFTGTTATLTHTFTGTTATLTIN